MSTKNTRQSFVTMALQAALEDLTETVNPKCEQVSETAPDEVVALSNGEGPQAEIDGIGGKSVIALEDELNTMLSNEVSDGGLAIQEDLEEAVSAVAALESISEALTHTVRTKTASTASNAGFSMAMEQVLRSINVDTRQMTYGLEADDEEALSNPSSAAKKMANFAKDAASKVSSVVSNAVKSIVEFIMNFISRIKDSVASKAEISKKLLQVSKHLKGGKIVEDEALVNAIRPCDNTATANQYNEFFKFATVFLQKTVLQDIQSGILDQLNHMATNVIDGRGPELDFIVKAIRAHFVEDGSEGDVGQYTTPKFIGGFVFTLNTNVAKTTENIVFKANMRREEGSSTAGKVTTPSYSEAFVILNQIAKYDDLLSNLQRSAKHFQNIKIGKIEGDKQKEMEAYMGTCFKLLATVFTSLTPGFVNAIAVNSTNYIRLVQAGLKAEPAKA